MGVVDGGDEVDWWGRAVGCVSLPAISMAIADLDVDLQCRRDTMSRGCTTLSARKPRTRSVTTVS